jgi:probable rRNA maturation factor
MSRGTINFYNEGVSYKLKHKLKVKNWICDTISAEGKHLDQLSFIFCCDEYLLGINEQFLKHSTYTDIITFDNSERDGFITGDIFISIERVKENAEKFKVAESDELHRVLIHGTLHLLGYPDKPKKNKIIMTAMENKYLALLK